MLEGGYLRAGMADGVNMGVNVRHAADVVNLQANASAGTAPSPLSWQNREVLAGCLVCTQTPVLRSADLFTAERRRSLTGQGTPHMRG